MKEVMRDDSRVIARGGVLSDLEIKEAIRLGHIICDPAPRLINGSSVDVTLGHNFYHAGGSEGGDGLFNPFSEEDVRRYFGEPMIAKPWGEVRKKIAARAVGSIEHLAGIDAEHPVIALRPNERILAHTHEFVGILPPGTTSMQARSTTGRMGISACYCAGWGDPGYVNRWTMEIHNLNESAHVVLPVGFPIAQIVFSSTGPVEKEYALASGNYQALPSHDFAAIKAAWTPEQMLPKAYRSKFILPEPVQGMAEGIL